MVLCLTPLGTKAYERNASEQAASSLCSNISQKIQIASPKQSKISNSGISKETKSSAKKHIQSKDSLNESNHPFGLYLVHKKPSENELQVEAI